MSKCEIAQIHQTCLVRASRWNEDGVVQILLKLERSDTELS